MEDKNKPLIPTLKEVQSKPQLKIKGLASGGLSLIERLKQFKKKDLAFIAAGLGVLFTAPVAEHFLMSPSDESGAFKEGWNQRDGGVFGKGGSPYEGGINGLAPGSMAGGGSDVITPLNVRDPSALVMGPGATQAPPATAAAPTPPAKSDSSDWKDALANAAAKGAAAATKKASLPVPKVPLGGSGLRGLGAASGGGGGSFSLPALSAGNVPNRGGGGDSTSFIRGGSGIRGVAGARGSQNASAGSMEALKAAAAKAGSDLNRGGSAQTAIETAASRSMGGGDAGGGGGPGLGREDKAVSQSQNRDSKSPGESLDFLRMKQEQEKAIELKWKLREKAAMRWPNLYDKMLEEVIMTPIKELTKGAMKQLGRWGSTRGDTVMCYLKDQDRVVDIKEVAVSDIKECGATPSREESEAGSQEGNWYAYGKNYGKVYKASSCSAQDRFYECINSPTGDRKTPPPPPVDGLTGPGSYTQTAAKLQEICTQREADRKKMAERGIPEGDKAINEGVNGAMAASYAMSGFGDVSCIAGFSRINTQLEDKDINIVAALKRSRHLITAEPTAPLVVARKNQALSAAVIACLETMKGCNLKDINGSVSPPEGSVLEQAQLVGQLIGQAAGSDAQKGKDLKAAIEKIATYMGQYKAILNAEAAETIPPNTTKQEALLAQIDYALQQVGKALTNAEKKLNIQGLTDGVARQHRDAAAEEIEALRGRYEKLRAAYMAQNAAVQDVKTMRDYEKLGQALLDLRYWALYNVDNMGSLRRPQMSSLLGVNIPPGGVPDLHMEAKKWLPDQNPAPSPVPTKEQYQEKLFLATSHLASLKTAASKVGDRVTSHETAIKDKTDAATK